MRDEAQVFGRWTDRGKEVGVQRFKRSLVY